MYPSRAHIDPMRRYACFFLTIAFFCAASSRGCFGQGSESLQITVLDGQGAVVRGASITLVSRDGTDAVRTALTAENGVSFLQPLPSGTYNLEIVSPGFKKLEMIGIHLANSESRKISVNLEVSSVGCGIYPPSVFYEPQVGNINLSGKFQDLSNGALGNAIFKIKISGHGKTFDATSSKDGSFQFSSLEPGKYKLTAKSKGYSPVPYLDILITQGNLTSVIFSVVRKNETHIVLCE